METFQQSMLIELPISAQIDDDFFLTDSFDFVSVHNCLISCVVPPMITLFRNYLMFCVVPNMITLFRNSLMSCVVPTMITLFHMLWLSTKQYRMLVACKLVVRVELKVQLNMLMSRSNFALRNGMSWCLQTERGGSRNFLFCVLHIIRIAATSGCAQASNLLHPDSLTDIFYCEDYPVARFLGSSRGLERQVARRFLSFPRMGQKSTRNFACCLPASAFLVLTCPGSLDHWDAAEAQIVPELYTLANLECSRALHSRMLRLFPSFALSHA